MDAASISVGLMGALVGLVQGLTGAGGGILAIPALMLGFGWTVQQATPLALLTVAFAAAVGAMEGLSRGIVRYKAAMLMAITSAPMSWLGIRIAHHVAPQVLGVAFATLMLFVAYRSWHASRSYIKADANAQPTKPCQLNPATGRIHWTPTSASVIAAVGAVTGLLSGMLGVGGGFVIVPALQRFSNLSMHSIVATSLLVISLVGSISAIQALSHGVSFTLAEAANFMLPAVAGMLLGRMAIRRLPVPRIQQGFALLVLAVACWVLWRNVA